MSVSVTFYQSGKKVNSTKIPVMIPHDVGTAVELKSPTNLLSPTLILSAEIFHDSDGNIINPLKFVECYISDFKRYYFIRSWAWVLGRWECSLEVDVLASFKTEIGNTTAYVLRSASSYNPDIIDTKYPAKMGIVMDNSHETTPWNINIYNAPITSGFFVVAIANNDSNAVGATSHYAFSAAAMQEFMNIMYAAPTWLNITDTSISTDLQKMLLNPIQYITGITWIPTGFNTTGLTGTHNIPYGWWTINIPTNVVYRISGSALTKSLSLDLDIINHPQYDAAKRKWVNLSPYTQVALRFEPFGMFSLDTSKIMHNGRIRCGIWVDLITGIANLSVYTCYYDNGWVAGELVYTTSAQLGVPISVSQMAVDAARLANTSTWVSGAALAISSDEGLQEQVSNTVSAAANAITQPKTAFGKFFRYLTDRNYRQNLTLETYDAPDNAWSEAASSLMSTVKQVVPSVGNAALAISGVCESKGTSGSFTMLQYPPTLIFYFQPIVDTDDSYYGIPLCASVQINTLSGFVLCANGGNFTAGCTEMERQAIVAMMQAGFYYE